jgi:hypothetical protein
MCSDYFQLRWWSGFSFGRAQPFGWSGGHGRDVKRRGYPARQWNSAGTESVEVADWASMNPPNNKFACAKAAVRHLPLRVRISGTISIEDEVLSWQTSRRRKSSRGDMKNIVRGPLLRFLLSRSNAPAIKLSPHGKDSSRPVVAHLW